MPKTSDLDPACQRNTEDDSTTQQSAVIGVQQRVRIRGCTGTVCSFPYRIACKLSHHTWRKDEKTASCLRICRHTGVEPYGLCPDICPHWSASPTSAGSRPCTCSSRVGMADRILPLGRSPLRLGARHVCGSTAPVCTLDTGPLAPPPTGIRLGTRPLEVNQTLSSRDWPNLEGNGCSGASQDIRFGRHHRGAG